MNTSPIVAERNEHAAMLLLDQREHYFAQSAASIGGNVAEYHPCEGAPRPAVKPGFNSQQDKTP